MNWPFFSNVRMAQPIALLAVAALMSGGCKTTPRPGTFEPRQGDEIVVAGQLVHTGTPVVLWMDPGGYDAYRVERRFSPFAKSDWENSRTENKDLTSPNRYNLRKGALTDAQIETVRGGGWDLPLLQQVVDQFVIHYDVAGTSRQCFTILQDHRDLSVHFMLDIDGTIYQTLDLKERAWHASTSNTRSVGVELANMGAYAKGATNSLGQWYRHDSNGQTTLTVPKQFGNGGVRTPGFIGHPARAQMVDGKIQGEDLVQYDFTPQQYEALARLTAALCKALPKIQCKYPTDASGKLIPGKLPDDELKNYHGVLGHYHIQTDKVDPGPAFDWERVIGEARRIMNNGFSPEVDQTTMGHERSRF
ncbi:MAG: negative regulator of beta-lactamase expression [Pedosphaera sp.]|nr:negative regulator of beta-lactamase expression [Pedosphaera sp.]